MERFEMNKEAEKEIFSSFINSTKEKLTTLVDNIKNNIKEYEINIENAETQIADAISSREKCENEITKMESKIDSIKEVIENVENTYKKIAEAYSSTSKGETKEIYSDIIAGAKANCDKDVEKNRSDIALLNSDIEAIKNNIEEFNRQIESLRKDVEVYKHELEKYKKASDYFDKESTDIIESLTDISEFKTKAKPPIKRTISTKDVKLESKKKQEVKVEKTIDPINEVGKEDNFAINNALQRLYDLTGYKQEQTVEKAETRENVMPEEKLESNEKSTPSIHDVVEKTAYNENLENLFKTPSEDVVVEPLKDDYSDTDMFEWEKILNGRGEMVETNSAEINTPDISESISIDSPVKSAILDNPNETVNQLLKPYGTTFERLQNLISDTITHKDGTTIPFNMTSEDIIKAINSIDGNDLRAMKTVGPEITIIRLVKKMKEGK